MLRFYESTFFKPEMASAWGFDSAGRPRYLPLEEQPGDLRDIAVVGLHVLASPPIIDGVQVRYESLLDDLNVLAPITNVAQLKSAVGLVATPQVDTWDSSFWGEPAWREEWATMESASMYDFGLSDAELVAVEGSPLHKRALADLGALSTSAALVLIGGAPSIVFVGTAIGLLVVRPLTAFTAAFWEGGRPHVVQLGDDVTKLTLDALRLKLGIPPTDDTMADEQVRDPH